jgi:hypothetical protein
MAIAPWALYRGTMPFTYTEELLVVIGPRGERLALVNYRRGGHGFLRDNTPVPCFAHHGPDITEAVDMLLHMGASGCLDGWCPHRWDGPCPAVAKATTQVRIRQREEPIPGAC